MAHLDLPNQLSAIELQLRTMYLYYLEKGLNLSEPMFSNQIAKLRKQYECDNATDPLFFLNKDATSSGIVTTSEVFSFSNVNDVFVNRHMRYCPVPIHAHEYFEIICVVKGDCTLYLKNNAVNMQTGDTVIIPPFVAHTISVFNDDCIVYTAEIRFSTLRSKFTNLLSTKQVVSELFAHALDNRSNSCYLIIQAGDYYLGDNKLGDLVSEFNNDQKYSCEIINILTSAFLFDLLRKFSDVARIVTLDDPSNIEISIIKYIIEHIDTVTLTDLAKKFSYSNRQISRIIKERTGLLYCDLVNKIRMENVASMLVTTDLPISKIMEMSGISSPSYFFKTFKAYFRETPLEYRQSKLK